MKGVSRKSIKQTGKQKKVSGRPNLQVGHVNIHLDSEIKPSPYRPTLQCYVSRRTSSRPIQSRRRHSHPKHDPPESDVRGLSNSAPLMGEKAKKMSKKGKGKRSKTSKVETSVHEQYKLRKTEEWVDLMQRARERRSTGPVRGQTTRGRRRAAESLNSLLVSGNRLRLQQRPRAMQCAMPQAAYDLRSKSQISGCRLLRRRSDGRHVPL